VANGVVYIGTFDKKLYAFNAVTGKLLSGWPVSTGNGIEGSAAVSSGVVYIGSDFLYAFNATTGAQLFKGATGNQIFSSPAVVNGRVYVGSDDKKLHAYKLP
jgi:eukaryotic-like serine/threonine-protein kinase